MKNTGEFSHENNFISIYILVKYLKLGFISLKCSPLIKAKSIFLVAKKCLGCFSESAAGKYISKFGFSATLSSQRWKCLFILFFNHKKH